MKKSQTAQAISSLVLALLISPGSLAFAKENQASKEKSKPAFLSDLEREMKEEAKKEERGAKEREPAAEPERAQPTVVETEQPTEPIGTQISTIELTPTLGAISIEDKLAFSLGTHLSFPLSSTSSLFFEPSFYISFLNGDETAPPNADGATIFHLDAALRYDWTISESPVVPFARVALGPSLVSGDVQVEGETIDESYFNLFAGGGLKVLINPDIGARVDTGVTFQSNNPGLYLLGSVMVPL